MRLTPEQRQSVWDKSNGLCWYCGDVLPKKGWNADHLKPIGRRSAYNRHTGKRKATGKLRHPENDVIENLVPSCATCNSWKGNMSIESFRKVLTNLSNTILNHANVRMAKRYGIVEIEPQKIVFWFEKHID